MVIEESNMRFAFPDERITVKFDEEPFYRDDFNKLPESKGVDFISDGGQRIAFIEVKNCTGHEGDNRWRIVPDNKKRTTTNTSYQVGDRNSLDIEVSQKVAMTLAALCGVRSFGDRKTSAGVLYKIAESIFSVDFSQVRKRKLVILVLEGDFGTHTTPKTAIMMKLQRSIQAKLRWLDFTVSVVDSDTYNKKIFEIVR